MKINNFHFKVAKFISKNKAIKKTITIIEKNPAMANSLICAGIGIIAKPATILLMPEKNLEVKKDKQYGIARSISTGFIDFLFALALFIPLNKYINKTGKNLYETKNSIYYKNKEMVSNAKSMLNRASRFITLPLFAYLKFLFIDKIVDILFKKDKNDNKNRIK